MWGVSEEPLAAVTVGARVGHGQDAPSLVLQVVLDLVLNKDNSSSLTIFRYHCTEVNKYIE